MNMQKVCSSVIILFKTSYLKYRIRFVMIRKAHSLVMVQMELLLIRY
nr:MAG TPA: hypothetical protein [Crassvirales sp.]